MPSVLHELPRATLDLLAKAFSSGRVAPPYSILNLSEWVSCPNQQRLLQELNSFRVDGLSALQIGKLLTFLACERARQQADQDRIQMVWTDPEREGPNVRDTSVVARELISQATQSLLITTMSISKSSATFEPVHAAMLRSPTLQVTLVLNVDVPSKNPDSFGPEAVADFAADFWSSRWPWPSKPTVYYDPRAVAQNPNIRSLQHAKCIVADLSRVLITSANFTEAAQLRNIELGVLLDDPKLSAKVTEQFNSLIERDLLLPLPSR